MRPSRQRRSSSLRTIGRNLIKDRFLQIESLRETKWRQRAKRQWIREGDKNTRYFHAIATHQKRNNSITMLQSAGHEVTHHSSKADIFFQYFCSLIGKQDTTPLSFDLNTIYANHRLDEAQIHSLTQPWSPEDIRQAVSSWKNNKSPGPDGFTEEFYNAFIEDLLPDLLQVFTQVNQHPNASLKPLNDSYIILIPKKEPAVTPQDFRPISIINAIQKIYSKIMATKLKPLLHSLLSPNQTGFMKGRNILHGFHYA